MLGTVVCGLNRISLGVGQLPLDGIGVPAQLMQQRGGHRAEAVACHVLRGVAQTAQGRVDRVVAHRVAERADGGEQVLPMPRQRLKLLQDRDGLRRERDHVRLAHLHLWTRDIPLLGLEVKLRPFGTTQLTGPSEEQGRQLEGTLCRELAAVAVDRPQQLADLGRVRDRGEVAVLVGL